LPNEALDRVVCSCEHHADQGPGNRLSDFALGNSKKSERDCGVGIWQRLWGWDLALVKGAED